MNQGLLDSTLNLLTVHHLPFELEESEGDIYLTADVLDLDVYANGSVELRITSNVDGRLLLALYASSPRDDKCKLIERIVLNLSRGDVYEAEGKDSLRDVFLLHNGIFVRAHDGKQFDLKQINTYHPIRILAN